MEEIKIKKQGIQMRSGGSQRDVVYVSKIKNRNEGQIICGLQF